MKYLIDTNVLLETVQSSPNQGVEKWLKKMLPEAIYVSVLTLGEIRRGIERLEDDKKKDKLIVWLENDLLNWFRANIIPMNLEVAERWGYITAKKGFLNTTDSLIAATALAYNLKLVTKNIKHFAFEGLEFFNPFEYEPQD